MVMRMHEMSIHTPSPLTKSFIAARFLFLFSRDAASAAPGRPATGGGKGLFGELSKGLGVTAGLKKVGLFCFYFVFFGLLFCVLETFVLGDVLFGFCVVCVQILCLRYFFFCFDMGGRLSIFFFVFFGL